MNKLIKPVVKILAGAFSIVVFLLIASLTYSMLGFIFANSILHQTLGLVLFEIAVLVWLLIMVYKSDSILQYAVAAIGAAVGMLGTMLMVAGDVLLTATDMVTPPPWVEKYTVYGFILAALVHLVLLYAHFLASPDISAQIKLGAAQANVVDRAISLAEETLEKEQRELAQQITERLLATMYQQLDIDAATGLLSGSAYVENRVPASRAVIDVDSAPAPAPTPSPRPPTSPPPRPPRPPRAHHAPPDLAEEPAAEDALDFAQPDALFGVQLGSNGDGHPNAPAPAEDEYE